MNHHWKIFGGSNGNGAYSDGEWMALRKVCARCGAERWEWENVVPTSSEYGKKKVHYSGLRYCGVKFGPRYGESREEYNGRA